MLIEHLINFSVIMEVGGVHIGAYWIAVGVLVLYYVVSKINEAVKKRKLGAYDVKIDLSDNCLGLKWLKHLLKTKNNGTRVEDQKERFKSANSATFKIRMGHAHMISTKDPENIKAILATQFQDFGLGKRHAQFRPLLGDGIFTLDGEGWKHSRSMLRPQFAREQIEHVQILEPHVQRLLSHVRSYKGKEFDIQPYLFRLTVDSATEFLFGESVETLVDDFDPSDENRQLKRDFATAFDNAQRVLASRAVVQYLYFLIGGSKFKNWIRIAHKFVDNCVDKVLKTTPEEERKIQGYVFLHELAKTTSNRLVLRDQLLNILLAGRDTTAGLLSFTLLELAHNPLIWMNVRAEIERTFGVGENSRVNEINFESLKRCEYLKAVINESLRLHPSVPLNFRIATKDTTLPRGGGKDGNQRVYIKKGQTVNYAVSSLQRDTKYYGKDAEIYRPERWLLDETKGLGWAYLPFNGGPRICLGQQFALTEASYVLTRILQEFSSIKVMGNEYPPRTNSQLTARSFKGVLISLT